MDPKTLAEFLVENAPDGRFGQPHVLEVNGLRQLVGAHSTPEEDDAAIRVFQDRLEELTGYRAPDEAVTPAAPAPLPPSLPMPPVPSPEEAARQIIAQVFSAPWDGSEERLDVFAQRAMGLLDGLMSNGLGHSDCLAMIEEIKADLRAMRDL